MKSFIAALRSLVLPWGRTTGQRIVLDGDNGEIDIYDALNRLVVALHSAAPAGLTVGAATDRQVEIIASGAAGIILFSANSPKSLSGAALEGAVFHEGAANESVSFQIIGPSVDVFSDQLEILLDSQSADGSSEANLIVRVHGAETLLTLDRVNGYNLLQQLTLTPPASGSSAVLVAADGAHTGALLLATVGGAERARISAQGRLLLTPIASGNSVVFVEGSAGQTGALARLRVNSVDQFVVDADGTISVDAANAFPAYTPVISGGGAATFSTLTGWWQRVGKKILFNVYAVVGVAGSGAANVTITAPVTLYRGTRQKVDVSLEGFGAGNSGAGQLVAFTGGAGATFDRLRNSTGGNITGVDLVAGAIITAEGWVREA